MSLWLNVRTAWAIIISLGAVATASAAGPTQPSCGDLKSVDMSHDAIERAFGSAVVGWTEADFQSVRGRLIDCAQEIAFFRGYNLGAVGWYIDKYLSDIRNAATVRQKRTSYDLRHSALKAQVDQLAPKAASGTLAATDIKLLAELKRQSELLRREFVGDVSYDLWNLDYQIEDILRDNQLAIESEARRHEQEERNTARVDHTFDLDALREEPAEALRADGEAPPVLSPSGGNPARHSGVREPSGGRQVLYYPGGRGSRSTGRRMLGRLVRVQPELCDSAEGLLGIR